ncbi:Group II intron-encoded protein ltrA [Anoxybacillus thermarum]|uniref:Group II intron-encoded protein ltrA n=1 Tax=Anoxybacillus thermarum TaxID=404937 RepID=A0A0D0RSA9_9BACL|nr:CRISPR-associated primase-polymerase type A1 [Anoxybacillus thermarum]KIQ94502.1 Group II intron-encoded protein ltrA [Anoxybacillus thermarum]
MKMSQPSVFFDHRLFYEAWDRLVRTTTDAAGVDGVRIDEVTVPNEWVESVQTKLLSNSYKPSPVKEVQIKKNGKSRTIGILTVEDRYVHMLVKCWLEPLCLPKFSKYSFAYQPKKSATQAVAQLEHWLNQGYEWVGETDIRNFFDEIDHTILAQQLRQFVKDEDQISFIIFLYSLQDRGIVQGSPLSPLLANIYLHSFDEYMSANGVPYIRFSDDIVILDRTRDLAAYRIEAMKQALAMLKLNVHPDKTAVKHISETFEFLGFQFDEEGRKIPEKGIESLKQKLSQAKSLPFGEKVIKYEQILRGWLQYYDFISWDTLDEIEILLLAPELEKDHSTLYDTYHRVLSKLANTSLTEWHLQRLIVFATLLGREKDQWYWVALLTSMTHHIPEHSKNFMKNYSLSPEQVQTLLNLLNTCIAYPEEEHYIELTEWLIHEQLFSLAKLFHDPTPPLISSKNVADVQFVREEENIFAKFLYLFAGKEDCFLVEKNEQNKRTFVEVSRPLTVEDVEKHYCGELTIAQYIIRSNKTVAYAVIDIDITKRELQVLENENNTQFENKRMEAFRDAVTLYNIAKKHGFPAYLVDSGFRGYHLWFFFAEPVPLKIAYDFLVKITNEAEQPREGIAWELFPKQKKLKEGATGQAIKLPWGKHTITGRQSWFLNEQGKVEEDQMKVIEHLQLVDKQSIIRFVQIYDHERMVVGSDLTKEIGAVLHGCPVVKHMVEKAKQTNHLSHQERLLLLHVFAPLGIDGKDFVRRVMSYTFNYNKNTTEKFIRRSYTKSISCVRIRENFPNVTARLPCHCQFQLKKGEYPSPILHARAFGAPIDDKVRTIQSVSLERNESGNVSTHESTSCREINELVQKMIQLRKHQRGISEKLKKIEHQLKCIFDELGTDRIEIEQGYLVRKSIDNKDCWVIEL